MIRTLALTCGDPAGVGPEIIERWLKDVGEVPGCRVVPIGPSDWLAGLSTEGVTVGSPKFVTTPGVPSQEGAKIAWAAMEEAAGGCLEGRYFGVVTGPVNKAVLRDVGFSFPGQTEFFAARWSGIPSMAFAGKQLRVVLASWHLPLREVPGLFTRNPDVLRTAVIRARELGERSGIAFPRIGVCGLNPHAGEAGLMGEEERDVLNPVLASCRQDYPHISECLPGDTVFNRMLDGEFDVVVALYHDQGLAAVKTLEFHDAVNITLGLPYLRVSPDHGTGYEIAGKALARIDSFDAAVRWLAGARELEVGN